MLLFARKPAPVQVSWIGYPVTTGLATIDYKIVDNYTDPPGMTEQFYTEQLIRMPESFLCYLPYEDSPDISTLPALSSGCITFGSFNNFAKVSQEVIDSWAQILKTSPYSRLLMKSKSFADKETCEYITDIFIQRDVEASRIELHFFEPSIKGHLSFYNRVDIGLDTFPYSGTTTTCESLWMGVPVVTLAGNTHVSRVGASLLSNVGLPEFIAKTSDEYVATAVNLANDLEKLQLLRHNLRAKMSHSPLMDSEKFITHLEGCYRSMWEQWCRSGL
jgi:predicted O-linked N-acetylglucosamine transferase (SPINDLY family)